MFPYLILLGFPAFVAVISKRIVSDNKKGNFVISSFFFLFILILSLRNVECGNDTLNYKEYFESTINIGLEDIFEDDSEYGYALFQKLFVEIVPNFQLFLCFVAVVSVAPIWYFYRREAELSYLTVVLFAVIAPFSMYFSGLRQIIAMGFAIPAYYFSKNRKLLWFALMVVLAILFHRSAFMLLLLYPVCRFKITKKWLWFVIPVIALVFVFKDLIFTFLVAFVQDYYGGEVTDTGAYNILMLLIAFAVYSYVMPDDSMLDDDTVIMRNILLLAICLQCFASINPLAMRLNYYFLPFVPVLIPRIATRCKSGNRNVAVLSVLVMTAFFTVYFFANTARGGGLNIYPYIPFWS